MHLWLAQSLRRTWKTLSMKYLKNRKSESQMHSNLFSSISKPIFRLLREIDFSSHRAHTLTDKHFYFIELAQFLTMPAKYLPFWMKLTTYKHHNIIMFISGVKAIYYLSFWIKIYLFRNAEIHFYIFYLSDSMPYYVIIIFYLFYDSTN